MRKIELFALSFSLFFYSFANFSIKASAISYVLLGTFIFSHFKFNILSIKFNKKLILFSLCIVSYLGFSLIWSKDIFAIYFIKFIMLYPFFFLFGNFILCGNIKMNGLDKIVKWFVLLHSSVFLLQLLVYLFMGYYIDFNDIVREKASNTSYMSKDMLSAYLPIRATGMFSEPSFHAMAILPALVFLFNRKVSRTVLTLGLVSVVLSFSVAAFVVMILWLSFQTLFQKGLTRSKISLLVLISLTTLMMGDFVIKRVTDSSDYDSVGARVRIVNEINSRSDLSNLIGDGIFINELGPNGVTGISAAGIRDSGLYLNLIYSLGVFGFIAFYLGVILFVNDIRILSIISSLFLFKYGILFSSFWVLILILIVPLKNSQKEFLFRFNK